MRADIEANQKLSAIVIELFLRGRKIKILLVFISKTFILIVFSIQNCKTTDDTLFHHENTKQERTSIKC